MSVIIENPSSDIWNDILERPTQKIENIEHTVLDIYFLLEVVHAKKTL